MIDILWDINFAFLQQYFDTCVATPGFKYSTVALGFGQLSKKPEGKSFHFSIDDDNNLKFFKKSVAGIQPIDKS